MRDEWKRKYLWGKMHVAEDSNSGKEKAPVFLMCLSIGTLVVLHATFFHVALYSVCLYVTLHLVVCWNIVMFLFLGHFGGVLYYQWDLHRRHTDSTVRGGSVAPCSRELAHFLRKRVGNTELKILPLLLSDLCIFHELQME